MSRPVEQALSNLIPRHNGPLPPELVDLASSLLAQSRVKASTLKPDEEIGRTYVCANIACERLKTKLNLPEIEPRPPCPPKIYSRLYNQFDGILKRPRGRPRKSLQPSTLAPSTPLSRKRSYSLLQSTPSGAAEEDGEGEDALSPSARRWRGSRNASMHTVPIMSSRTPRSAGLKYKTAAEKAAAVPRWVAPCVRMLCKKLKTRKAIPHVLAGVEAVLTLPLPNSSSTSVPEEEVVDEDANGNRNANGNSNGNENPDGDADTIMTGEGQAEGETAEAAAAEPAGGEEVRQKRKYRKHKRNKLPALIAAMWFFVTTRLRGSAIDGKSYTLERKAVLGVLGSAREDEWVLERVGDGGEEGEENWARWEIVTPKDVDDWLVAITSAGWLGMDWFTDIVEGSGDADLDGEGGEGEGEDDYGGREAAEEHTAGDSAMIAGSGLGTMINDRLHVMTDAKRRDYASWKQKIMERIVEIEKEQQSAGRMDISSG